MPLTLPIRSRLALAAGLLWLTLVALGFRQLLLFGAGPGTSKAPPSWPEGVGVERDPLRPTLLVFLHPLCPCSRATVSELERLITRLDGAVRLEVFVLDDPRLGERPRRQDLEAGIRRVRGAHVHQDPGAGLAARFGAETSGQAFLFAPDGRLLFEGGLTPERGAEGANDGLHALLTRVHEPDGPALHAPVFGCPLREPAEGAP